MGVGLTPALALAGAVLAQTVIAGVGLASGGIWGYGNA
jgi:hypothetical protein